MPENASPAPLRNRTIQPATRPARPVPPPIDPMPPRDDWRLPGDTWEPIDRFGGADAARRELSRVRDRIDDDLRDLRQAIAVRQRQLPGWQLWPDDQLSNLRKAESALRDAKQEADLADRELRDDYGRSPYATSPDQAERRLDAVVDSLFQADAYLAAARPDARFGSRDFTDGAPDRGRADGDTQNPLDPGPGNSGRPVPPDTRRPAPRNPGPSNPGRPVPPDARRPAPRDPGFGRPDRPNEPAPRDPGFRRPGRPNDPAPRDPGFTFPWPGEPAPGRPGRPYPRDPQNPLDPGPSYPWRPQPPIRRDDLAFLIDGLRRDIRRSIDETRQAREYLRREWPEPWQPRPEPPPAWPYFDGVLLRDAET